MENNKKLHYQTRNPKKTDLHKILRENYLETFFEKENLGANLPFHLKREFDKYLACGVMAYGFARFHCNHCQKDKLVTYSCKGRTICPSCTGRRMSDSAKHLVENVLPDVPVRQWVLSMPYKHRLILSSNIELLRSVLAVYHRAISSFYKKKAKRLNLQGPQSGAISVVQRFGGALNLNVHFHTLFIDGVFHQNANGKLIFKEIIPDDEDILLLTRTLKTRINRILQKRGHLEESNDEQQEENQLSLLKSLSVQNLVNQSERPKKIGKYCNPPFEEFRGNRCVYLDGFSLHANVKIPKENRSGLEKLCRYISRGAISKDRISLNSEGNVLLKLKTQYTDGTTHLQFTPNQFVKRLIALIPPPRSNLLRYYGVFGARHKNRSVITSMATSKKVKKTKVIKYRTPWAELMKHVFKFEVDYCDGCGTKLELVSCISSYAICKKLLDHLNLDSEPVTPRSPRGPPEVEMMYEEGINYNQENGW
jgi:hypothetical protein